MLFVFRMSSFFEMFLCGYFFSFSGFCSLILVINLQLHTRVGLALVHPTNNCRRLGIYRRAHDYVFDAPRTISRIVRSWDISEQDSPSHWQLRYYQLVIRDEFSCLMLMWKCRAPTTLARVTIWCAGHRPFSARHAACGVQGTDHSGTGDDMEFRERSYRHGLLIPTTPVWRIG